VTAETRPALRIVRGNPTPEEVAALVAVLTARRTAAAPARRPRSLWTDRAPLLRRPLHPGPHAWRASALPR